MKTIHTFSQLMITAILWSIINVVSAGLLTIGDVTHLPDYKGDIKIKGYIERIDTCEFFNHFCALQPDIVKPIEYVMRISNLDTYSVNRERINNRLTLVLAEGMLDTMNRKLGTYYLGRDERDDHSNNVLGDVLSEVYEKARDRYVDDVEQPSIVFWVESGHISPVAKEYIEKLSLVKSNPIRPVTPEGIDLVGHRRPYSFTVRIHTYSVSMPSFYMLPDKKFQGITWRLIDMSPLQEGETP